MTERESPRPDEVEVSLFGPGYGECAILHVGAGDWIVVDSFLGQSGRPVALEYFEDLGLDLERSVRLIVATHWHDDHMRGLAELVAHCPNARFCCAGALTSREFLSVVAARRRRGLPDEGVREFHAVMTHLDRTNAQPVWAAANRRVHVLRECEVWSLSPDDQAHTAFLESLAPFPAAAPGRSARSLTPNRLSVAVLVRIQGGVSCLLGADLERHGWDAVVGDDARPRVKSSVFKVPHHGSANAHSQGVWDKLLEPEPFAILAPWRLGSGALPTKEDVRRLLARTPNAFATAATSSSAPVARDRWLEKRLKDVGARIAPQSGPAGMIRLRRLMTGEDSWRVKPFGSACKLKELAA